MAMTDFNDINAATDHVRVLRDLAAIKGLAAADIEELTITAKTTQGMVYTLHAKPTDTGWASALDIIEHGGYWKNSGGKRCTGRSGCY